MKSSDKSNKTERPAEKPLATPPEQRRVPVNDNQIDSRELFAGTREIIIVHGEDAYRLRLTAQNKLILTK